jgi:tetraacyldisaccharide 4'-kinase
MLARSLPGAVVAVGRHRDRVGRVVEDRFGPRVHVLDDGFQHLRLARDLDIVCVAPADLRDRPLPAGRLRERPAGLRRAGIVLLAAGGEPGDPESLAIPGTVFRVRRRPLGFFDPAGAPHPDPRRPFLLAGIARPDRFADDVRARVGSVAGSETFPDHHPYTASEIGGIFARARASGADAVVTTAKDAVRLPGCPPAPPLLVLRVAVEIEHEAAFRERLLAVARRAA